MERLGNGIPLDIFCCVHICKRLSNVLCSFVCHVKITLVKLFYKLHVKRCAHSRDITCNAIIFWCELQSYHIYRYVSIAGRNVRFSMSCATMQELAQTRAITWISRGLSIHVWSHTNVKNIFTCVLNLWVKQLPNLTISSSVHRSVLFSVSLAHSYYPVCKWRR